MLQTVIMHVSDVSQPQPQLGHPELVCGVKITVVAGNRELLFLKSDLNINILPKLMDEACV